MTEASSPQQLRYEQVLNSAGQPLKNFYTEVPVDLLPTATTYPEFFETNLLSPNRVIKTSREDAHGNLRIFYFHLLRLSFQIETTDFGVNKTFITNLRNYVLHPDFEIFFTPETEDQRDLYNDAQFKKLFCEFIYMLDQQVAPDTQQAVNCFPVIDEVMIYVLRSMLAHQGHNQEFHSRLDSNLVFTELSTMIGLSVTPYGNCWKFDDSDIFCLEHNGSELYLVYISGEGQGEGEELIQDGGIPVESSEALPREAVSLEHVADPNPSQHPPHSSLEAIRPPEPVYNYSTSYSSAAVVANHYPTPQSSTPSYDSFNGYHGATYTHSLNTFSSTDQIGLNHYSATNNHPFDMSPPNSDFDRGSANHRTSALLNKPQYEQFQPSHIRERDYLDNPKASMISMVSETYEFVDFTNTTTLYKDKVPRNQLKQNSPARSTQPIVHLNRQELNEPKRHDLEAEAFLSQFEKKKTSPIYESSTPHYDFNRGQVNGDFSKYLAHQTTPQTDVKQSHSGYDRPYNYSSEGNGYEVKSSYTPAYTYQPTSYRPLDTILESVHTTKTEQILSSGSSRLPGDATPIYKLANKNVMYTESGRSMPESADKAPFQQAPLTSSITSSGVQGDYYKDFTSSFTLEKLEQPYKANVRAIKNRIRGLKRTGLQTHGFGFPTAEPARPSFVRALYQEGYSDGIYASRMEQ